MQATPPNQVEPKSQSLDVVAAVRFAEPIGRLIAEQVQIKPGVRTSEFWLLALVVVAIVGLALSGHLSGEWAAVVSLLAGMIFQIGRNAMKNAHRTAATNLTELLLDRSGEVTELLKSLTPITNTMRDPKAGESSGSVDAGPTSPLAEPSGQRGGVAGFAIAQVLWMVGLFSLGMAAIFLLAGCELKNGTRIVESIGGRGSYTIDEFTGKPSGSGEITIKFRDGRDSKSVKPLGLRQPAVEALTAGPIVITHLPEAAR